MMEWQQTRQRYDKSPTSKFTPLPRILSDRNIFCSLRGGEKQQGPMPLGLFTPPSGWGLLIPFFSLLPRGQDD